MKILLFEWLNSGGLWLDGVSPSEDCPTQRQGCQMLNAVADDLMAGDWEVAALVDSRLTGAVAKHDRMTKHEVDESINLPAVLLWLAHQSDAVLVIAPETSSILSRCLNWLEPVKHKLLNPDAAFTKLTSSKTELFEYLKSKGFAQFPEGVNFQKFLDQVDPAVEPAKRSDWNFAFELPAVLKPDDGAGSEEVVLITDWSSWPQKHSRPDNRYRLEAFVPGTAVSVSVLCGGDQCDVLTPTIQLFDGTDADVAPLDDNIGGALRRRRVPDRRRHFSACGGIGLRSPEVASQNARIHRDGSGHFGFGKLAGRSADRDQSEIDDVLLSTDTDLRIRNKLGSRSIQWSDLPVQSGDADGSASIGTDN